jgi:hypothetical protein
MAEANPGKKPSKRRSPLSKRQLSPIVTSTNLWIPDRQLLVETARQRRMTEAALVREILHRWAVVERRAPGTQEDLKEEVLIELQKEALGGLKSITDKLAVLVDVTSGFGELLNLNEVQLTRLTNTSNGHYNMSAQTFAALWSLLELVQRYFVERMVAHGRVPCMDEDVHQMVVNTTDSMRAEGLQMIQRLMKDCGSPQPIQIVLVSPGTPGTTT